VAGAEATLTGGGRQRQRGGAQHLTLEQNK